MVEYNNLEIRELPQVLKKETLMEGYWNLINDAYINCEKLHTAGIECSITLFDVVSNIKELDSFVEKTGISKNYILSLSSLLSHHSFKPVSLKKIEDISFESIKTLSSKGIKNTGALLHAGKTITGRIKLAKELNIPIKDLEKMAIIADLMRKPGIKSTKVKLFVAFGIKSLKDLGQQDPMKFRLKLANFINETSLVKAIPTPKEVMTDVSWARLYPQIIEL